MCYNSEVSLDTGKYNTLRLKQQYRRMIQERKGPDAPMDQHPNTSTVT
jgi:hypothetical protein